MMAYHAGMLLTRCCQKRDRLITKWSHVVRQKSCYTSSTTSDKIRQIFVWTLVCVSIHLECWLDKAMVEIVTWAAVDGACKQQLS